jgi:hypothetical protein
MKFKIILTLITLLPAMSFAVGNQCKPSKGELIKYTCPIYVKKQKTTLDISWQPEGYSLTSKNTLEYIGVFTGNSVSIDEQGQLRGSGGTTKLNQGYHIYGSTLPNDESYYLQCRYKNSAIALYKKIDPKMRACDVHYKKSNEKPWKQSVTGTIMCSTSETFLSKNNKNHSECSIGQPANQ